MAAQYTEVTLEDMEKFLKRGFRALRPKQGLQFGEYYYDLHVSDYLMIRVWTSIKRSGMGAGVGEDAIRVQIMSIQSKRPVVAGKAPIVKRTQGWKNSLQDRIEDAMEQVEEKESAAAARNEPPVKEEDPEPEVEERNEYKGPPLIGTFTNYRGEWRARIQGQGVVGAKAILETKGNRRVPVTLEQKLWGGQDNYGKGYIEIWTINERQRTSTAGYDYDYRGGVK